MPFPRPTVAWCVSLASIALIASIAACSTKKSDSSSLVLQELGRQDIGPSGGTVTAGAVTIDVPAGALTTTRTFIISEVTSGDSDGPASTQLIGSGYALQPDDIDFAQPVTVTVALDTTQVDQNLTGAVVLFRAPGTTAQWSPYGADQNDATKLVAQTTHFSRWRPSSAPPVSCFRNQCGAIMPPGPPDPSKLPGQNCDVPSTGGPGVHCEGKGANYGPPYQCHCIGSDQVLGTYQRLPPDVFIATTAVQCGAVCNAPPIKTCDLGLSCDPPASNGVWNCSTTREPRILCNYFPPGVSGGSGIECSCINGKNFTIPGTDQPTNDQMEKLWESQCGGMCTTKANPNDASCPGTLEYPNEAGTGCVVETAGTCSDNHYYGYDCSSNDTTITSTCTCKQDGKPVKTVQGSCAGPMALPTYQACGFPAGPT
jgi:hypothetical protein